MYCELEKALNKKQIEEILFVTYEAALGHRRTLGKQHGSAGKRSQYTIKLDSIEWLKKHIYELAEQAKSTIQSKYDINIDISGGAEQNYRMGEYGIVSEYHKGDSYSWHKDSNVETRTLTIVIQLSEEKEYKNGDLRLQIEKNIIASSRGRGNVLAFTPETLHGVAEVTEGVRKSLIFWFHENRNKK